MSESLVSQSDTVTVARADLRELFHLAFGQCMAIDLSREHLELVNRILKALR